MTTQTPELTARRSRIRLCGSLVAEIDGRPVGALPGHKGRLLFACLVIGRSRPITRDELIDVIWPAEPPADPDGTLAVLLARVRAAVGHDVILGRGELVLELGDDAWVDWEVARAAVAEAERRLAAGDAHGALACASEGLEITRLPLLPRLSTPWVEERRRELVDATASLLESVGAAALRLRGEHLPLAERGARELIEREPYRESAYALLMQVHEARGNVAEALRVYDQLRRVLRDELGLAPTAALTALAGRLLACEPASNVPPATGDAAPAPNLHPTAGHTAPAPNVLPAAIAAEAASAFAGRRAELHHLLAAVERGQRVIAVAGEPGVGKTRLVAEVAATAHRSGAAILHGRAQRDAAIPFAPIVEALRGYLEHDTAIVDELLPLLAPELGELARVVPALRPATGGTRVRGALDVRRMCDAVAAVLEAAARCRPVLLVLEDLQWADRETLVLLRHLARVEGGARLSVIATLRDDAPHDACLRTVLLDLHREHQLEPLELRGLDEAETAQFAGAGDVTAAVQALHARSGGNPFYLAEILASSGSPLPRTLRAALDARLDPLPSDVRAALEACAGEGTSFDVVAVARATGASPASIIRALGHAVRAGLLVADAHHPQRFAFRHGIVWYALIAAAG